MGPPEHADEVVDGDVGLLRDVLEGVVGLHDATTCNTEQLLTSYNHDESQVPIMLMMPDQVSSSAVM